MKTIPNKKPEARLTLRLPKSLYDALKKAAAEEGLSLNTYMLYILSRHDICKETFSYTSINKKNKENT